MVTEFLNGLSERAAGLVDNIVGTTREAVTAGIMDGIHRDPSQLDAAIGQMGQQAQDFYNRLGPTGQENLKGIIAQDARFLPALARAMEGQPGADGQSQQSFLTSLPPGMVNMVLTEMNNDPAFRARMVETLEQDPNQLITTIGAEALQDSTFGMGLAREGIGAAMRGELNMGALGGMNMGGLMQGLMGGMMGNLMQNFTGMFDGLKEIFGKIFEALTGMFGGDRMVQSVGDARPGDRPIDNAAQFAQTFGVRVQGVEYEARGGEVAPRGTGAEVTVSADTPMDPSRRVLPDPTTGLAAGPR